jgi:lambda repressor-like predicted transcriptional regulator
MKTAEKEKTWTRTSTQNLMRHKSGVYYARLFANGKQTWKSLRTDLLEVAKSKLRELTENADKMVRVSAARDRGRMTMGDCAVLLEKRLDQGYGLKGRGTRMRHITSRTQKYRKETISALWRSWPELRECDVRKITVRAIEDWAEKFAKAYSATRYNATLDTLRMLFRIAQDADARVDNPTDRIGRMTVKQKSRAEGPVLLDGERNFDSHLRRDPKRPKKEIINVVPQRS